MKMRAAVLEEFGQPLVVQELELDEPKGHEVLVRLVACGVCHTDLYTASGVDPSGLRAVRARPRGRRRRRAGRRRRHARRARRPRRDATSPRSAASASTAARPRTNLCLAIREQQNKGFLPDGTTRLSRDGERIRHFMGTSTFAEYTVMPEIALSKVNPEAPLEGAAPVRLRPLDRARRRDADGEGRGGLDVRRVRRRHGRASAPSPAAGCRARSGSSPSTCARSAWSSRAARARPTLRVGGEDTVELDPRADRRVRRGLHVRGDRQREGDAPGRRVGAHGLGPVHGGRRRGQGRDARRRPAPPDHRAARRGLVVRRAQEPRPGAAADRPLAGRRHRRRSRSSRTS